MSERQKSYKCTEYHYPSSSYTPFLSVYFVKILWRCFDYSPIWIWTRFNRPFFSLVVASLFSARLLFRWAKIKPGLVCIDLNCSLALLVELTPRPCWFRSCCSSSLLFGSSQFVFNSYTWPEAVSPTYLTITKFTESFSSVFSLTKVLNDLSELFAFK